MLGGVANHPVVTRGGIEREIPMKKLAVRISAVSGGLMAMLLAGGANLKFK